MALINCNFFSECLSRNCSMTVLLPQRPHEEIDSAPRRIYPVLYLLHGLVDDHTSWVRRSSIERYVEKMNLAVVMPAVERSFYTDMAHGGRYWMFISEELPLLAREFFPLSPAREENFAAGISMGGYGAFKLALSLPERFAAAASLSGALDIIADVREDDEDGWQDEMRDVFGRLDKLAGSRNDLFALAEKAAQSKLRPRLYQCCGTEDPLYNDNLRFRDLARRLNLDLTYRQGPGGHDWAYWDKQIQKILEWLPIP
jgi:putative tributyrin esterase